MTWLAIRQSRIVLVGHVARHLKNQVTPHALQSVSTVLWLFASQSRDAPVARATIRDMISV
jgi:hypothetical protein